MADPPPDTDLDIELGKLRAHNPGWAFRREPGGEILAWVVPVLRARNGADMQLCINAAHDDAGESFPALRLVQGRIRRPQTAAAPWR